MDRQWGVHSSQTLVRFMLTLSNDHTLPIRTGCHLAYSDEVTDCPSRQIPMEHSYKVVSRALGFMGLSVSKALPEVPHSRMYVLRHLPPVLRSPLAAAHTCFSQISYKSRVVQMI